MSKTSWRGLLLVLALFLLSPVGASAQEKKNSQSSAQEKPRVVVAPDKLPLPSVPLISTEEAARSVAKQATARAGTAGKSATNPAVKEQGAEDAVIELHPADASPLADSPTGNVEAKGRHKSLFKNVHGSAYGAAASGVGRARGEAGAVGADSGNGKFNIYLEGEHTRESTPAPH